MHTKANSKRIKSALIEFSLFTSQPKGVQGIVPIKAFLKIMCCDIFNSSVPIDWWIVFW